MSFHATQVVGPLEAPRSTGIVRIGGHDFPGPGTYEEEVAAMQHAMVNIYAAIEALAQQVQRLSSQIDG